MPRIPPHLFTLQSLGARAVALGESYVAVAGDVHGIYWNPASIASAEGLQLAFSHRPSLFSDVLNFEYFAATYNITSKASLGATFNYVDLGEQVIFSGPNQIERFHTFNYVAGISYGHQITNAFLAGVTLKSIFQDLGPVNARSWAADLGLIYTFRDIKTPESFSGNLNVGVSLSNLGQEAEFIEGQGDPLPHLLRLGVAYEFASQKTSSDTDLPVAEMLLSFEYQNILNSDDNIWEWGAGAELKMLGIAAARVGYHERHPKTDQTLIRQTLETGITFGFGLDVPVHKIFNMTQPLTLQFDFASAPQNGFVDNYQMYTFEVDWKI